MKPQDFSKTTNLCRSVRKFQFFVLAATPIDSKRRAETWKRNRRALVRSTVKSSKKEFFSLGLFNSWNT